METVINIIVDDVLVVSFDEKLPDITLFDIDSEIVLKTSMLSHEYKSKYIKELGYDALKSIEIANEKMREKYSGITIKILEHYKLFDITSKKMIFDVRCYTIK